MMRLTRILVFPLFLSASWINSPSRNAFQNAQRIPWKLEFDIRAWSIARAKGLRYLHWILSFSDTTNTHFLWIHFGSLQNPAAMGHKPILKPKPRLNPRSLATTIDLLSWPRGAFEGSLKSGSSMHRFAVGDDHVFKWKLQQRTQCRHGPL